MNILIIFLLLFLAWFVYSKFTENQREKEHQEFLNKLSPEERSNYEKEMEIERLKKEEVLLIQINGPLNPDLICPHCQTKGQVHSKIYSHTRVVNGKVGGILKTDIKINQVESGTMRYCRKCESRWSI